MKFYAGVTDNTWYDFLAHEDGIEEVNFWHPGGSPPFKHLPEGTPFLFKLKSPHHHITGGGFFTRYTTLPLPLAWDAFDRKNGAASYQHLAGMIGPLRSTDDGTTPEIGCSILSAPFFFPREEWIPVEDLFAKNIVTGKTFDTATPEGAKLWDAVQLRMASSRMLASVAADAEILATYGDARLMKPRLGQGAFKALVTNAYRRSCAITGEHTLPVLEAAHIRPFGKEGFNNTYNGMLLRSDFHKLFDIGLVTVTPEYKVVVSQQIHANWFNGTAYYRLHGQPLASLPAEERDRPRADLLTWHNENVFEKGGHHAP